VVRVVLPLTTASAAALESTERFQALPQTTAAQAIAYINQQRVANGIPGELVDDPAMDHGCWEFANRYKLKPGQLLNKEVDGQPGYSAAGNAAAASSEVTGGIGEWARTYNPFTPFGLGDSEIFNPASTTAWYAETEGRWGSGVVCVGTGGTRKFTLPTFFSLPADGSANVLPWEVHLPSSKPPWGPGDEPILAGYAGESPTGPKTGPTIRLYPEGPSYNLFSLPSLTATLMSPTGLVPVEVEQTAVWGPGLFMMATVIPVAPLATSTAYTLVAQWLDPSGEGHTQIVHFTTASATEAGNPAGFVCETCHLGFEHVATRGGSVVVKVSPAVGERVNVVLARGHRFCIVSIRPCPKGATRIEWVKLSDHRIPHYRSTTTFALPAESQGNSLLGIEVDVPRFEARGYQWQPNSLCTPACI
jgi:hypothetical protein